MVSKAADAAVPEDLRDIRRPMYDGSPLNLDRFLQKLNDWQMTVTEDMVPAAAEKHVFKLFQWRLPEVLQELYFVAAKELEIRTLKQAKKWLNEQERLDAPPVAAKRWRALKLQHDGREVRLPDWRDYQGQYVRLRLNREDWNEGDEQSCMLNLLSDAWVKQVTKKEAKRAKSNHTIKMMLDKEHDKKVVTWTRAKVAWDFNRQFLRHALLITVSGDGNKAATWRLDENEVGPRRYVCRPSRRRGSATTCWSVSKRKYARCTRTLPTTAGSRQATAASASLAQGLTAKPSSTWRRPRAAKDSTMMTMRMNPLRLPSVPSWPATCQRATTGEAASPFSTVGRGGKRMSPNKWAICHCPLESSSSSSSELLRLLRAELPIPTRSPDVPDPQSRHGGVQEGRRNQEGYVSQHPGSQSGVAQ